MRERIKQKEQELELPSNVFEHQRIAKREIARYADIAPTQVLHEAVVVPEHDATREALRLEPEEHDAQIDALLEIVGKQGIRNALSIAAKMNNPHIEDDLHRALVRYIAEGLPVGSNALTRRLESSQNWRALHMTLFEVHPQSAFKKED